MTDTPYAQRPADHPCDVSPHRVHEWRVERTWTTAYSEEDMARFFCKWCLNVLTVTL